MKWNLLIESIQAPNPRHRQQLQRKTKFKYLWNVTLNTRHWDWHLCCSVWVQISVSINPGIDPRFLMSLRGLQESRERGLTCNSTHLMLLACSVNTPIHNCRFHLHLHLCVQCGLGLCVNSSVQKLPNCIKLSITTSFTFLLWVFESICTAWHLSLNTAFWYKKLRLNPNCHLYHVEILFFCWKYDEWMRFVNCTAWKHPDSGKTGPAGGGGVKIDSCSLVHKKIFLFHVKLMKI